MCKFFWNYYRSEIWSRTHRMHILYKGDNGELLFFFFMIGNISEMLTSLFSFFPSTPIHQLPPKNAPTHTYTLNTVECHYRCSNASPLTPVQWLPQMAE